MYLLTDTALVTSASDLTQASNCEFGFLRVLDKRLGFSTDPLPDDDAMLMRAAELGNAHEARLRDRYRDEFGDAMVEFDKPPGRDAAVLRDYAARTRDALLAGAPVVFQGVFFDESDPESPFIGYADFLVKQPDGSYRVVDSKLSRHVRVTALLQLAAYHEQLLKLGVAADGTVELILGNDTSELAAVADIAPVFRRRRTRMHAIIAEHRAEGKPVDWHDERYARDGRCKFCKEPSQAADDLFTVAGLRAGQRTKFLAAGIRTLTDLAETEERPDDLAIPKASFAKLHLQAKLQHTVDPADSHAKPPVVVVDPLPIASLPAPNAGDLFFDFEGDPMYSEPGIGGTPRWGLDYLFGWVDAAGDFDCLWAHSLDEERIALRSFLKFVTEQRQQHPGLHIYHYAAYEKTHLLSIAARHGEGEDVVDQLLREGVLVDLYPIVRGALRIGTPSYSIKKLEPLYMGDEERAGVTNAADSIGEYVESSVAAANGNMERATEIRDAIARYNEYDCVSTLKLRDWLRALPEVQGMTVDVDETELDVKAFEPSALDLQLQALGDDAEERDDDTAASAYRMAAAAIDYHRREVKSFWWEHYDRLEQPSELWEDTRGIFVVDSAMLTLDWHKEGRQRNERRHLYLRGQWAPGSSAPRPGGDVFLVYGNPLPYVPPGHRTGQRLARAVRFSDPAEDADGIFVIETRPDEIPAWDEMPTHITPGPPPRADSIVAAIEAWGETVVAAAPEWPDDAMSDLLLHKAPATVSALEPMTSADDGVRAVIASLVSRESGYLAVQGPPGTGKTYLAAHVIHELVERHHWKVGITAQSHKVVENVLDAVVLDANLNPELVAKAVPTGFDAGYYADGPFSELPYNGHAGFALEHENSGYVIGGTAWDLTNRKRVQADQLDLLVIDEAGQFSLANTIGVAASAKRILLLGDPQQLPQVSQGIHPAPVDGSALGHVIGELAVLPDDFGYFLEESRRMDEAVTRPVSQLSYDGLLRSHASTEGRMLAGVAPGLHSVPTAHVDNSTFASEEADRVVELVREHLGALWTSQADGSPKPLDEDGIIVVTPYNAQVELIRGRLDAAGYSRVVVGTVDKFQGREAVISIVSLAASSADDVPRGLDFLLSRNRLNVSISRAQWAAYLVYSPALLDSLPQTAEGVATLSRFISLVEGVRVPISGQV
ncbi:TM0106 family RecB-like putative nuclease [Salinibacterium sp. UTAS2018]|uniref:TM0106 family RecB-like putative nuclease n=1 Tax=Salinibacterium sp. UTAS2018 TaxID=2508880 RepID=UPI00100943B1|nr:bifunctional RecB family nuclease/DEAD/DEAH box helicase [Salinibacterium sp. UTAS2018]QAV70755.1 TM0106 family RecB-like putative nuclease [Salinibacterium sp. UTAS2018]